MTDQTYDVALSFFFRDIGLARELHTRLKQDLNVFMFERAQDEVTGSGGDEKFRKPFREALLSVVLLRPGYGEKGWTGVEKVAIVETCLERAYANLFVVRLEKMQPPPWVPKTNIYFDLELFSIEQLVGAIKAEVIKLGGRPEPMTVERRAQLHLDHQRYEEERKEFRKGNASLPKFIAEVQAVFQFIELKCIGLRKSEIEVESASNAGRCVIRNSLVSMVVFWKQSGYGQIEYERLNVEEYKARMELPHERFMWIDGRPYASKTESYELELTTARDFAWKPQHGPDIWSSQALANRVVIRFLELTDETTAERNRKPLR